MSHLLTITPSYKKKLIAECLECIFINDLCPECTSNVAPDNKRKHDSDQESEEDDQEQESSDEEPDDNTMEKLQEICNKQLDVPVFTKPTVNVKAAEYAYLHRKQEKKRAKNDDSDIVEQIYEEPDYLLTDEELVSKYYPFYMSIQEEMKHNTVLADQGFFDDE